MSSTSGSFPLPPAEPRAPAPAAHAPSAVWPRRPEYLADATRCPACFTPLSSSTHTTDGSPGPVCSACGLDLSGTEAAGVFAVGTEILTAEARRQKLLTAMRTTQAQRAAARAAAVAAAAAPLAPVAAQAAPLSQPTHPAQVATANAPTVAAFVPGAAPGPVAAPHSPVPTTAAPLSAWYPSPSGPAVPPPSGHTPTDAGRPRRSGIQILMLTVGIILVSIMAIFFVLVAYLVASLEVRSVLTAVASVAVFGIAMVLHRRRLPGTAEGIAVLAIVLLLLDVWIVRANDLFGSAAANGWLYTGIATGLVAVALAAGFRILPLRSLSIAAAALAPFAVFATTFGVLDSAAPAIRTWAAFAAVGAAALAWRWVPLGRFEQGIVRLSGVTAAAIAILPGLFAFSDVFAGPVIALAVLAVVWFGHLALSPLRVTVPVGPTDAEHVAAPPTSAPAEVGTPAGAPVSAVASRTTGWHLVAAIGLGVTVAAVGPALFFRATDAMGMLWIPAVATSMGAVVLAVAARLSGATPRTPLLQLATAVPLALSSLLVAPAAVLALWQPISLAFVRPFSVPLDGALPLDTPEVGLAVPFALIGVALLTASALAILRVARRLGWIPAAIGVLGLVAVSVALETPPLAGIGFLALSVSAVVVTASHRIPMSYRLVAASTAALAIFGLFVAGLANTATFPFAAVVTLALLVVLYSLLRRARTPGRTVDTSKSASPVAGAGVLAAAAVVLLGSVSLVPSWFQTVTGTTAAQAAPALLLALTSIAILIAIPLTVARVSRVESATLGVIAAAALGAGLGQLAMRVPVDATPFLLTSGLVVAVAVLWQLVRAVARWAERYLAAIIAPLVALWFGSVLWDEVDPAATLLASAAAIVLLAAAALLLFRPGGQPIAAPAVAPQAQPTQPEPRPVNPARLARICWDGAIAVASVAVIVQAFLSDDNGWLALLFTAVAALIIASGEGGVFAGRTPRRHVAWAALPLAVSALWLALARNNVDVVEYYTLPVSGLLLAILALILLRRTPVTDGVSTPRTVLFSAAVAIALFPSALAVAADEPLRTGLTLAAAAAVLLGGPFLPAVWQGIRVAVVVWLAGATTMLTVVLVVPIFSSANSFAGWENEAAAASLLVGGALWILRRQEPRILGTLAAAAAPVVVALPLAESIVAGETGLWEFLLVLVLACALFVGTSLGRFRSEIVRWTALGAAVVLAATALTTELADPFETATVPIAIALLAAGALRLGTDPAARSWPHLGAGTALLLVPSLLADFTGTDLVRIVALGVAALAVFGAGLALKLGAPTVIGATVLVIHAIAQLWPWISGLYGAIPWWLWAGVGGVILIVFAATYEKRIRDFRAVSRSIASLR